MPIFNTETPRSTPSNAMGGEGAEHGLISGPDLARQRLVLFSARLRLSPETQSLKESALDCLVEQLYVLADEDGGLTAEMTAKRIRESLPAGSVGFPDEELRNSVRRLAVRGRLSKVAGTSLRYRLTTAAAEELRHAEREARRRLQRVIDRLFPREAASYETAFIDALAIVFGRLGDEYARAIKGDAEARQRVSRSDILRLAVRYCRRRQPELASSKLVNGLVTFIQESDPDSTAIKWNMAQNYYLAAALGLDPSGSLLSKEMFGRSTLYLDTNVVLAAIEPTAAEHKRFKILSKACASLEIALKVCQITVDELRRLVAFQRQMIRQVEKQIPEKTGAKVRDTFFQLFRRAGSPQEPAAFDRLFSPFEDAARTLRSRYGVELVDDRWFTHAPYDDRISTIAEFLQDESAERRLRPKNFGAALHDATLLSWVEKERQEPGGNAWVVTLDRALPAFAAAGDRPHAISLDALLQWISPLAVGREDEDEVASIFASALAFQLLPRDQLFDLRDFVIFSELALSCRELPSEDVEKCIQEIRTMPGRFEPSKPEHRERIAHEMSRFFADPGRKHKEIVAALEARIKSMEIGAESAAEEERIRSTTELEREKARLNSVLEEKERQWAEREKTLTDSIEDRDTRLARDLKRSAYFRSGLGVLGIVVLITGAVLTALRYSEGSNSLQKIVAFWPVLVLAFGVGMLVLGLLVGEKRRKVLPRPFRTRLGH